MIHLGFFDTIEGCIKCGYMDVLENEYQKKMKKMDGEN